jgi:hypothetical protein
MDSPEPTVATLLELLKQAATQCRSYPEIGNLVNEVDASSWLSKFIHVKKTIQLER